ncbi:DUF883 family protein [Chelativorans alearense]|uniref:DUF883 family protein n=1 Tax=Chelativorans alearense TaxID=2681495 RepID=UPI0013D1287D|nr:DUF883 family protein [Chelativorans alearense]
MATTRAKATNKDADPQSGAPDLTADIRQLREDIARLADDLRKTGSRSVSRAQQAARESAEDLRGSAEEWQDDVAKTVREKPFTALALAVGVGWLLAMMTRR